MKHSLKRLCEKELPDGGPHLVLWWLVNLTDQNYFVETCNYHYPLKSPSEAKQNNRGNASEKSSLVKFAQTRKDGDNLVAVHE